MQRRHFAFLFALALSAATMAAAPAEQPLSFFEFDGASAVILFDLGFERLYAAAAQSGDVVVAAEFIPMEETLLANIVIGGCDTGVPDFVFPSSFSMQSLINSLIVTSKNHGDFVSSVNQLLQEAEDLGLITKDQRKAIHACAVDLN